MGRYRSALWLVVTLCGCVPPQQPLGYQPQQSPQQASGGGGGAACLDVTACYGKCPGLAADCTNACDATGTPAATAANAELFRCIVANQCADEACITSACAAPLQACAATPGNAPTPAAPIAGDQPQPPPPGQPAAQHLPAIADAEFVFVGQNGLEYVPELRVEAQGVPVVLEGLWADTRHNFTLELAGNTYVATSAASSAYFQSGATTTERGTWALSGTTLAMTPREAHLAAVHKLHDTSETSPVDPPRAWSLVGATLAFEKFGDPQHATYRVDGIIVSGTAPSWDPVGAFAHTMRRAR